MVMVGTLPGETNRYNQMAFRAWFRAANQNNFEYMCRLAYM